MRSPHVPERVRPAAGGGPRGQALLPPVHQHPAPGQGGPPHEGDDYNDDDDNDAGEDDGDDDDYDDDVDDGDDE